MAQQIGQSQEYKILYQILLKIKRLKQVVGKISP